MKADAVIIGAGISGASIAWHLAKKGMKNIKVVDASYLTAGATGRCGAGVRTQWGTKTNCLLAKRSVEFFEQAAEILGYEEDIEFKQAGYLILATTEAEEKTFDKNLSVQHAAGIPSRRLTVDEALNIVPHLNPDSFLSASFCDMDGHLNPFRMTDAFYQAAKRLGVDFHFYERVNDIITAQGRIRSVVTDRRTIETDVVIDAAGGHAREIAAMAGVDVPVFSEKHEILATEPTVPMQGPMVMSFSKNIYCQQVPHGSFLAGRSNPDAEPSHDVSSSWEFLEHMASTVCDILPAVGKLRVVRQWGGLYNNSPDRQPIISAIDALPGFYVACGFSGHGFMFSPVTGDLISDLVLGRTPSINAEALSIDRFESTTDGDYETSVV